MKSFDDHAAQVAEADLPGDLLGRLDVHLVGGFLGRIFGAEAAAVDVDRHQRLRLVDDDRAAQTQRNAAAVDLGDLFVEVVLAEQRFLAFVQLQAVDVARHHELEELLSPLVRRRLVDVDRIDLRGEDVANGPDDHVAFFVDARGAGLLLDPPGDDLPEAQQVGHVAGELAARAVAAGGANDEADALGRVQLDHDVGAGVGASPRPRSCGRRQSVPRRA